MDYVAYFKKHKNDYSLAHGMRGALKRHYDFMATLARSESVKGLNVGDILDLYETHSDERVVIDHRNSKSYPMLYVVVARDDKTGVTIVSQILPNKKLSNPIDSLFLDNEFYLKLNKRYVDELIVTGESPDPFEFFAEVQARIKEVDKENKAKRLRFSINNKKMRQQVYARIPIGTNIYLEDYESEELHALTYGKVVRIETLYDDDDWTDGGIITIELSDGSQEEFETDDIAGSNASKSIYLAEPTYY